MHLQSLALVFVYLLGGEDGSPTLRMSRGEIIDLILDTSVSICTSPKGIKKSEGKNGGIQGRGGGFSSE